MIIPASVTSIGDYAFSGCSLTSITIPHGVTSIGLEAFSNCSDLKSITIPDSVTSIGDDAFRNCRSLTSITIPYGVTKIGKYAFCGTGLTGITIPSSVTSIGEEAFNGCSDLKSVTIPASVTSIGDYAFGNCSSLTSVAFLGNAPRMGNNVFYSCAPAFEVYYLEGASGFVSPTWSYPSSILSHNTFTLSVNSSEAASVPITSTTGHNGTANYTVSSIGGGTNVSLTAPDIAGMNLIGWTGTATSPLKTITFPMTSNITVTANYAICTYNVTFDLAGKGKRTGGGELSQIINQGSGATVPTVTANAGWVFNGWDKVFNNITEVKVVTAQYSTATCNVEFDLADKGTRTGGGELSQTIGYGSGATAPRVTANTGWTFIGWNRAFDKIKAVTTVTAQYSPITCMVTYDPEGGSVSPTGKTVSFFSAYGVLATPTRAGYTFIGWWTGDNGTGTQVAAARLVSTTENHTLYAKWIVSNYTVNFDLTDRGTRTGGGALTQTIEHGNSATSPAVSGYSGWTFTGWDRTFDNITANLAVTAQWLIDPPVIGGPPVIGSPGPQKAIIGVQYKLPLTIESAPGSPLKSVTVAGLPTGLKYDAKTMAITGAPTVAVNKTVTVTAKNTGKTPSVLTFEIAVESLPAWATGTFSGSCVINNDFGTAVLTVTALGKVTGKLSAGGVNYTFSALTYDIESDPTKGFFCTVDATADKKSLPLSFTVGNYGTAEAPSLSVVEGWFTDEAEGDPEVKMYRNIWKDKDTDMTTTLAPYIGYYTAVLPGGDEYGSGYLSITVNEGGDVKTAGKLADGTALSLSGTLIFDETGRMSAVIYISPTAYQGGCLFGLAEFVPEGGSVFLRLLDGTKFLWENRNPLATEVYDKGFDRELGLSGGRYDKLFNLRDYYGNKLTVAGVGTTFPSLFAAVRYTDFDPESMAEYPPKKTTTVIEEVGEAGVYPNGVVLKVTPETGTVGTGLAAPKGQTPSKYPGTGEYNYDKLDNPTGLTISLTHATGIFRGSFNVYYDYISAQDNTTDKLPTYAHVIKKASYEGVLTPVRNPIDGDNIGGRGFFLWPGKDTYASGRVDRNGDQILIPYSFNWSYDFLINNEQ